MWFNCVYRDQGQSIIIQWLFLLIPILQLMQIAFQLVSEALKVFFKTQYSCNFRIYSDG